MWHIGCIFAKKIYTMNVTSSGRNASSIDLQEIIVREVEDMDDAELYKYLVATRRDGKEMLSEAEQDAFERKMGLGKYR